MTASESQKGPGVPPGRDPAGARAIVVQLAQASARPAQPVRDVSLRALLPQQAILRLTHATALSVKPIDLLTKTRLAAGKGEAKRLIAAGAVRIDGAPVSPEARAVEIHLGSVVEVESVRARLVP